MGCVHSCGVAIEESGEERDNSNNGKRQDKKRERVKPTIEKESSKEKSFEKGKEKSWYLDQKEIESSSLKRNKLRDVKHANISKDTNSKAMFFFFFYNFWIDAIKQ